MESVRSSVRVNGSRFAIAIHGGVSDANCINVDFAAVKTVVGDIINAALKRLIDGDNALEVAESAVLSLENAPVLVTIKGASSEPSSSLTSKQSSLCAAEETATSILTSRESAQLNAERAIGHFKPVYHDVGAVVLDSNGILAAAASAEDIRARRRGISQIGDTRMLGSGIWADDSLAVVCTSSADRILRHSVAGKIASLARSSSLSGAVKTRVAEFLQDAGVTCGVIALEKTGEVVIDSSARLFVAAYGSGMLGKTGTQQQVLFVPNTIPLLPRHEFMRDGRFAAGAYRYPTTLGQVVVVSEGVTDFTALPLAEFVHLFQFTRKAARALTASTRVRRCALASDGKILHLVPLHGLSSHWSPVLSTKKPYYAAFPGFLETASGPEASKESLDVIRARLLVASGLQEPFDETFLGDATDQNLFARIVRGELEQWRIWESKTHIAFLTPFGNTPGYTVLIPRRHLSSDVFSLAESDYVDLVQAAHTVADVVKRGLGVARVGIFFEGFEIDYTHVKLIPVYSSGPFENVIPPAVFRDRYPGFITTQAGPLEKNVALLDAVARGARQWLA